MSDIEIKLDRIEKVVNQILEIVSDEKDFAENKWISEAQAMKMLNVSKRGIDDIRRKGVIHCSSSTGRNFLFYKPDVENYIYDHSAVRKRRKNTGNKNE